MSLRRHISDLFLMEVPKEQPEFRKRVEWLMLLRLVVTTFLLGVTIFFQLGHSGGFFEEATIPLYVLIGTTFLLGLLYAIALPLIPNLMGFSFFQVMVDIAYFTALIYFTGGAFSVFTLIYIFPIITSGILHRRRGAMITATIASLLLGLMIVLQFYRLLPSANWPWKSPWSSDGTGYLLWVNVIHMTIFFLVAFLSGTVTEQLESARDSLSRSTSQFRKLSDLHSGIVHSIPSGIITTDEGDRITFVNSSGANLLQTTLAETVSLPLTNVFPVHVSTADTNDLPGHPYLTVKEINGERVHLEVSMSDLRGSDGSLAGRLVVFQDVTILKSMEKRMRRSESQAALVRVAARMAHEIRNPLASLRGATELLSKKPEISDQDKRLLNIVIRESDRLNSLLGDFLLTVTPGPQKATTIALTDLVQETVTLFSQDPRFSEALSLETLISKGVEVWGDPSRLKQAIWNVLANALEATPDGGAIRVILEHDRNKKTASLTIHDSGPGIPPEMMDRIFEPFTTTKERGSGLGLSLVNSIVSAHNGSIEVQSDPGTGTAFSIRLPLASQQYDAEKGDMGHV